jgi:phosphoribosyl-ATP pyrophosphohydrolase
MARVRESEIIDRLFETIEERKRERPDGSYVVQLLDGGIDAVAAKLREECEEVIDAARSGDSSHLEHEVADLLFHAWVMLALIDASPDRVYGVLTERFGTGGLAEKASRDRKDRHDG